MRRLLLTALLVSCGGDEANSLTEVPAPNPDQVPPATAVKRLTRAQYRNAIRDLLGEAVVVPTALEPDIERSGLFSIGASISSLSPRGVEQYEAAALSIAEQAMALDEVRSHVVGCSGQDAACTRETLGSLAKRAWRRPPRDEELDVLVKLAADAEAALGGFDAGLTYGIAAILQMPSFLYRADVGEDDPDRPGKRRYSSWEMAGRVAFFLTNTAPDDELLDAADRGELLTDEGLAAQADRLLASGGAREAVANFFSELYTLHELDHLTKDPNVFRHASPEVGPAARREVLTTVLDLVFERDADVGDLLTSRRTFADRRLAAIYNVKATSRDGFGELTHPETSARRGLLGQVGILAQFAHPVASSATLRGKFIRQVLICGEIPPPPANVNTALPEPKDDARTLKERVKLHLTNPACSGCHLLMDPIGLGLEQFDGLGRFRELDNGATIDPSGDLDGVPYADSRELAEVIRDHPDFAECFVGNLARYATSEASKVAQRGEIERLTLAFEAHGRRVLPLMKEIVMSPIFRWAGEQR